MTGKHIQFWAEISSRDFRNTKQEQPLDLHVRRSSHVMNRNWQLRTDFRNGILKHKLRYNEGLLLDIWYRYKLAVSFSINGTAETPYQHIVQSVVLKCGDKTWSFYRVIKSTETIRFDTVVKRTLSIAMNRKVSFARYKPRLIKARMSSDIWCGAV